MNRDEWKKYLRQTAEDIRLPESLEPENIEKQLEAGNNRRNQIKAERKAWYRRPALRNVAAAAAILLIFLESGRQGFCREEAICPAVFPICQLRRKARIHQAAREQPVRRQNRMMEPALLSISAPSAMMRSRKWRGRHTRSRRRIRRPQKNMRRDGER